ncbi:MAG: hypothetical protein HY959_03685 [Ignavibacteriae bacterium]|nr:hypothetical protein [Ignavibacteriota bacterium]
MPYSPGQLSKSSKGYTPGSLSKSKTTKERKTVDIESIDQLKAEAEKRGLKVTEKKPSIFRRTLDVLSRPLYASASIAKDLVDGGDINPLKSFYRGISGQDKTTYSDVLEKAGVQNKFLKGGLGFALDIALDPTTYFGGAITKGVGKVVGVAGKAAFKAGSKLAPETFTYLEAAGKSLKDAFGSAFVYGHGTSKGLADEVSLALNKMGIAKEGVIEENIKSFGTKYTRDELEEAGRLMIKNRRQELLFRKSKNNNPNTLSPEISQQIVNAKAVNESSNPKVNELVSLFRSKANELAKKAGIPEEKAYRNYFPFIDESKITGKTKSASLLNSPDESSPLFKSNEGYLKEFKNLIPDESLLKKPIEAYSRKEFQIVRDKIAKDSIEKLVGIYGKPLEAFSDIDSAIEAGYTAIKDKKFGKVIGYLKEKDANFINDYLFPEFKTLDVLAKGTGYDGFTKLFKTAVTAYFPAFHIRNYVSGNVQNYQVLGTRALAPSNVNSALAILKGSEKELNLGGKIFKASELKKVLEERFGGASQYISDIGNYIDELSGNNFRVNKIGKARQIGNFVEMNQKAVATVTALKQGRTLEEALSLAEKAGFDYSKITKFEAKVMRRLVPFYTFARKNAELQINTILNNPERIINQTKLANALSNMFGGKTTEEDLKGLPEWVLGGLGFKVKDNKYLSQFGLPLEEHLQRWNKPIMSTLSSLNPIIKYPLEAKLGFDFFREEKITDINSVSPGTGELLLKAKEKGMMPDWIDQLLNVRTYKGKDGKDKYTMSPKSLHVLRNLPTSRLQGTLEKIFDKDLDKINKWTAFISGAKVYDIDQEQQQYFQERDLRRDIEDQLLKRGIGSKFENFYIYK